MLTKTTKEQIIKNFQINPQDTGSAAVQVALLSADIEQLTTHITTFKKDVSSRRGLMQKIEARKRLLKYVKNTDEDAYQSLLKKLNLRK
ncbi:30S ribosomal protein S15 [bacterium]|jgi:small subunit ribosomal protein S15|nr:30S ribosomal protein S15 [bacterium]